jgi:hypothetical protein
MADAHVWLANIGLIGLVVFSAAEAYGSALPLTVPLALSGIATAVSVYLFVANMWLTFSQPIPER